MTCLYLATAVLFFSLFQAAPGFSFTLPTPHTWKVSLPANSPYDHCTIVFHADNNNQKSGQLNVTRGGANVSWTSSKPLSYVIGWCGGPGYALQPRTCAGVDFANGNVNTNVACTTDVSLKVCPKKTNANQYNSLSYGFCPN